MRGLDSTRRREAKRRPYRKMADRIKQGSKGAFLIDGHTEYEFEGGKMVAVIIYDVSGTEVGKKKRRKKRQPKAKKPRTILRKR